MANRLDFIQGKPRATILWDPPYGFKDGDLFSYVSGGKYHYAELIKDKESWYIAGRYISEKLFHSDDSSIGWFGAQRNTFFSVYKPIVKHLWIHRIIAKLKWNSRRRHFQSDKVTDKILQRLLSRI